MLCPSCQTPADLVACVYTRHTPQVDIDVALLTCSRCGELTLIETHDDGYLDKYCVQLYPVNKTRRNILPPELRECYDEAFRCFKAKCYLASVIMCRRALELVCRYHHSTAGPLFSRIRKLHSNRTMNDALFAWAESVRASGNLVAHDPSFTPTVSAAAETLSLTGAIINFLYSAATANKGWCRHCGGNLSGSETSNCLLCGEPLS
jgi:hypothetical protein